LDRGRSHASGIGGVTSTGLRTRNDLPPDPDLAWDLAPENGVLMPEHEQFCVLGDVTAQQYRRDGQQSSVSWYSSETITGS
jgi:hypothetical protein